MAFEIKLSAVFSHNIFLYQITSYTVFFLSTIDAEIQNLY